MEQNKTGTNKLAERIIADAKVQAENILMEANMNAMSISADQVDQCGDLRRGYRQKREAAVQSVLDGCRTRASIDGRKSALCKKRDLIDAVFERAYMSLCASDAGVRSTICAKILHAEAESGETVVPAAADRAEIARILFEMGRSDLMLAEQNAPIDGGFLLIGKSYEKDCSFRAILEQIRASEETTVAKLLFD